MGKADFLSYCDGVGMGLDASIPDVTFDYGAFAEDS